MGCRLWSRIIHIHGFQFCKAFQFDIAYIDCSTFKYNSLLYLNFVGLYVIFAFYIAAFPSSHQTVTMQSPSNQLSIALSHLIKSAPKPQVSFVSQRYFIDEDIEKWDALCAMKMLLCLRGPTPPLPLPILEAIDVVLLYERSQKLLTFSSEILCSSAMKSQTGDVKLSVWEGDITTLTDATAIVNAANSRMLGCFQPNHKCIDNAINAAAGPRLREKCFELISEQGFMEPTGYAKVTPGYNLPAEYIIHAVGPQLTQGIEPNSQDRDDLAHCYTSCLEAAESLPASADSRKVIVFCCLSTGVFAFPQQLVAQIAVSTTKQWISTHSTTIRDIVFNVFTYTDHKIYLTILQPETSNLFLALPSPPPTIQSSTSLALASTWVSRASTLLITAGAGLSASAGLDYNSTFLFSTHLHGYTKYGFKRLYDLFCHIHWPSEQVRWGYYFHHLLMIRN